MTKNQKYLWNKLPINEWIKRNDADFEFGALHRCGHFQRAISYLHTEKFIELKMGSEISDEMEQDIYYIRRKTTTEIQKMLFNKA